MILVHTVTITNYPISDETKNGVQNRFDTPRNYLSLTLPIPFITNFLTLSFFSIIQVWYTIPSNIMKSQYDVIDDMDYCSQSETKVLWW